ncbi:MAG TPA: penicillin-binding protein 2 [Candidatus Dormibacteraeota bacterium]|nr:penicillin-binding protein 2 [Candidatus Dormibacteraeota bacterium]
MTNYSDSLQQRRRLLALQALLVGICVLIGLRLVYLQILQHGRYAAMANSAHQRQYEIPAKRGEIFIRDGEVKVPLALNQTMKLLYADPSVIHNKPKTALLLAGATGDQPEGYMKALEQGGAYVVLKRKIDAPTAQKISALNLKGVGLRDQDYRVYPEGALGSQVLGFVNTEGNGQYGIEGFLNLQLKGVSGLQKAKTDTNGIPIATAGNTLKKPVDGTSYVLTIDRNIQAQVEKFLKEGVDNFKAKSGSVIVMDPKTGAVKAMANYPNFDPNEYGKTKDFKVFSNESVSSQFEPGSGFKIYTMAAGLDSGKIKTDTTYDDTGSYEVDGYTIKNAHDKKSGPNTPMTHIIRDSLNTGVIFILRSMGTDATKITPAAKQSFYEYITKRFGFGVRTGIEQAYEAQGNVNPPKSSNVNYANMTFGQGVSVTMIQMVTAASAIANGGKLYQPYLVDQAIASDGNVVSKTQPKVIRDKVISEQAARETRAMMQVVVERGSGWMAKTPGYNIAGKTGTAQVPKLDGKGYEENKNIGSFVGFAPTEDPRFVVIVRVSEPQTNDFAEKTTVPVFANITRWLLKYYAIAPSG